MLTQIMMLLIYKESTLISMILLPSITSKSDYSRFTRESDDRIVLKLCKVAEVLDKPAGIDHFTA